MITGHEIVCLSSQDWTDVWTRKQRFMRHFAAQGNRVLYIETQASLVSVPERKVIWGERTGFFAFGEKLADILGTKYQVFEASDIDAVLSLGKENE